MDFIKKLINFIKTVVQDEKRINEVKKALLSPKESLSHHGVFWMLKRIIPQARPKPKKKKKKNEEDIESSSVRKKKKKKQQRKEKNEQTTLSQVPIPKHTLETGGKSTLRTDQTLHLRADGQDNAMEAVSRKFKKINPNTPMEKPLDYHIEADPLHYLNVYAMVSLN